MIIYGSAVESLKPEVIQQLAAENRLKYCLSSYYYLKKNKGFDIRLVQDAIIDSGAHSFQKGTKVDWESYTHEYARWIRDNDTPKIRGYFEMDVDNIIGYDNVLKLRHILEKESGHPDKIIPVWHRNRGIKDYQRTVAEHPIAAVTGFKNEDIQDSQYLMFLKEAWKHDCWLHGLGMTRRKILDRVPFDSVDSASWKALFIYGRTWWGNERMSAAYVRNNMKHAQLTAYADLEQGQQHYLLKWRNMGVHNHPPLK